MYLTSGACQSLLLHKGHLWEMEVSCDFCVDSVWIKERPFALIILGFWSWENLYPSKALLFKSPSHNQGSHSLLSLSFFLVLPVIQHLSSKWSSKVDIRAWVEVINGASLVALDAWNQGDLGWQLWGNESLRNWSEIKSKNCLGWTPWAPVGSELPPEVTSASGNQGNHAGSDADSHRYWKTKTTSGVIM